MYVFNPKILLYVGSGSENKEEKKRKKKEIRSKFQSRTSNAYPLLYRYSSIVNADGFPKVPILITFLFFGSRVPLVKAQMHKKC